MHAVVFDDRRSALPGVELAALSIRRWAPDLPLLMWVPGLAHEVSPRVRALPSVEVWSHRDHVSGTGWDVKPTVLLHLLKSSPVVLWIDSDVILNGDLIERIGRHPQEVLVATEEYYWGHFQGESIRTTGLGLSPRRTFRATLNTGVLRVSTSHRPLLEAWAGILASDAYQRVQGKPAGERPPHYFGDQEVLTGLLGGERFANVPVAQLQRGKDVAQCFGPSGYTVAERLRTRRQRPLAVHAMGAKPWDDQAQLRDESALRQRMSRLHAELGLYSSVAQQYRGQIQQPATWMDTRSRTARAINAVFASDPVLRELPLALGEGAARRYRRWRGIGRIGAQAQ